jgi:hypothetical protein
MNYTVTPVITMIYMITANIKSLRSVLLPQLLHPYDLYCYSTYHTFMTYIITTPITFMIYMITATITSYNLLVPATTSYD